MNNSLSSFSVQFAPSSLAGKQDSLLKYTFSMKDPTKKTRIIFGKDRLQVSAVHGDWWQYNKQTQPMLGAHQYHKYLSVYAY